MFALKKKIFTLFYTPYGLPLFNYNDDPSLTGFEHIFVGEKEQSRLQGHHFMKNNTFFPKHSLLSYNLRMINYASQKIESTHNAKGGFFVGCSVEGLMALATACFFIGEEVTTVPKRCTLPSPPLHISRETTNPHLLPRLSFNNHT